VRVPAVPTQSCSELEAQLVEPRHSAILLEQRPKRRGGQQKGNRRGIQTGFSFEQLLKAERENAKYRIAVFMVAGQLTIVADGRRPASRDLESGACLNE